MRNIILILLGIGLFAASSSGSLGHSNDPSTLFGYVLAFIVGMILQKRTIQSEVKVKTIKETFKECKSALLSLGIFSGVVNILSLTGSFFMLEVYDRVLPSKSISTLYAIATIALFLYICQGLLEVIRSRILLSIGISINNSINNSIYKNIIRVVGDHNQPIRDLDSIRNFLASQGPVALFDIPWIPLYLSIIFLFHPALGWIATGGALFLVSLTILTEYQTKNSNKAAIKFASLRQNMIDSSKRNSEVLLSMGMLNRFHVLWNDINQGYMTNYQKTANTSNGIGMVAKITRMVLQSGMLAVGAYLVIHQEASGGVIIASSILTSRALAPVDLAIANWKGFISARSAWKRLKSYTKEEHRNMLSLPAPKMGLVVENISYKFVKDISFSLRAGQTLGIIGCSGSGKTSLARLLVGVCAANEGQIRLDGASLNQWNSEELGKYIGYLPQDVELFSGTISQNISRFEENPKANDILDAANKAEIHSMILKLPKGYDTNIGDLGSHLSGGQRQRIGLARALYGNPFFIVLDEPNSNLDIEGEGALTRAMLSIKQRNGITIVISHRQPILMNVDYLLVMKDGRVSSFGPREKLLPFKQVS